MRNAISKVYHQSTHQELHDTLIEQDGPTDSFWHASEISQEFV